LQSSGYRSDPEVFFYQSMPQSRILAQGNEKQDQMSKFRHCYSASIVYVPTGYKGGFAFQVLLGGDL